MHEVGYMLLNRQRMRSRDRKFVEKHQKFAERLKERPAGEKADAFIGVHRLGYDKFLAHCSDEAQLHKLFLSKLFHWIRFIKLDSCTINLFC